MALEQRQPANILQATTKQQSSWCWALMFATIESGITIESSHHASIPRTYIRIKTSIKLQKSQIHNFCSLGEQKDQEQFS